MSLCVCAIENSKRNFQNLFPLSAKKKHIHKKCGMWIQCLTHEPFEYLNFLLYLYFYFIIIIVSYIKCSCVEIGTFSHPPLLFCQQKLQLWKNICILTICISLQHQFIFYSFFLKKRVNQQFIFCGVLEYDEWMYQLATRHAIVC